MAAQSCRRRGRIGTVGVTGLDLRRDLSAERAFFQVSCSYGPGRYDPSYEEQGHDYPIGFVRWTEQRASRLCFTLWIQVLCALSPLFLIASQSNRAAIGALQLRVFAWDTSPISRHS